MRIGKHLGASLLCLGLMLTAAASFAGQPAGSAGQSIKRIVARTTKTARETVRRETGIDPFVRGYDPDRHYTPLSDQAAREKWRDLQRLNQKHDRAFWTLEKALERKLAKIQNAFERDARQADTPEKIREKRAALRKKVDRAYATFSQKLKKENQRFDKKRTEIVTRAYR